MDYTIAIVLGALCAVILLVCIISLYSDPPVYWHIRV
jgi:hypothetical protein